MARNKKTPTSSPSASPPPHRKSRTPSPKKMASVKASPENKEASKAAQHQNTPPKKKSGAKAVSADSRGASKSPENKNPNIVKTAANLPKNNDNKPAVGCKKRVCPAKEQQGGTKMVAKAPVDNKSVTKHDNHHNKPKDTKPQSNKTSPSMSEDELDRVFPSFKKDRESAAASFGRLLYDTFDEVSKASGSKGLEASRWASPSTESSPSASGKREPVNNKHQKDRSPRRNIKKNTSNNTSTTSSPSPRGRTGHPASNKRAMTPPHTVAPIINTPATLAAEREAARVGKILFDAFNDLGKTGTRAGLEASRWATVDDTSRKNNESVKKTPAVKEKKQTPPKNVMPQTVVNVDNTSDFLAALRARTAPVSKKPDAPLVKDTTQDIVKHSPKHDGKLVTDFSTS